MRPKRWIDPADDRPREGDLRIVRTKCGQVRAAKWQQNYIGGQWVYADRNGDGYDVVAVGVTWERKRKSGVNRVQQRKLRVPDALWEQFSSRVEAVGSNRNAVLVELIEQYVR